MGFYFDLNSFFPFWWRKLYFEPKPGIYYMSCDFPFDKKRSFQWKESLFWKIRKLQAWFAGCEGVARVTVSVEGR